MKIKSLLIGSAAALVAATGAKAADAVVIAEPEPVEYVRVCDAYGAGFFYIPGTETCLSISGYVWFQMWTSGNQIPIAAGGLDTAAYYGGVNGLGASALRVQSRARVNFDARSDTEWGTLRGFIRLQSTWSTLAPLPGGPVLAVGDGPTTVDQAFIELGGLRMGYTESAWAQTQGGGASNWGAHSWGGMYYGYSQAQLIAYTFQGGNGFFGTISLEDDGTAGSAFVPDVVVKVGVNQGWGSVWAKFGYDEEMAASAAPAALIADGWAASLGMQFNIPNSPGSSLRLIGFYATSGNKFNAGGPGVVGAAVTGYEYSVLASYNHAFSSTLSASVALQYFANVYLGAISAPFSNDAWAAELSIVWFPVTNFEVRAEIHYDDVGGGTAGPDPSGVASGFLRFTRYF